MLGISVATPNLMPTDAVRARHPLAHELTGIGGQIGCLQAMTRFGHRNQPYRAVRVYDRSGHEAAVLFEGLLRQNRCFCFGHVDGA